MIAVCLCLTALVAGYTLWMLIKLIYHQSKINDASLEAFQSLNEWCETIDDKVIELEQRIKKAEILAGNASNKATAISKKLEKGVIYDSEL